MSKSTKNPHTNTAQAVLDRLMNRVLRVRKDARSLNVGPVHALRVTLRSCRAIAAGMREVDAHPGWRKMNKLARGLFRSLGALRDSQALREVLADLAPRGDETRNVLQRELMRRERALQRETRKSIKRFDRKLWRRLTLELPGRATRMELDSPVFHHMALQRWNQAYELHARALRANTRPAFHELRIALKRFRYVVDNFLPHVQTTWGKRLRELQTVLGGIQDLDNLERMLGDEKLKLDPLARRQFERRVDRRCRKLMNRYRDLSEGREPLWNAIRAELPDGESLRQCVRAKLTAWAEFRDPQPAHARHVARLALDLFDGLTAAGLPGPFGEVGARELLEAAALLHDVGRSGGRGGAHKRSYRMIRKLDPPLGWIESDVQTVALLARYHRGALPSARQEVFATLPVAARERLVRLAGVLRLAAAFDTTRDQRISRLWVEVGPEALIINAKGYLRQDKNAQAVADHKALLEAGLGRLVLVRPGVPAHVTIAGANSAPVSVASQYVAPPDDPHAEEE